MAFSGISAIDRLLGGGYPDRSAVLIVGPSGTGKESLGYRFINAGLAQGDFCLYVTRLSVREARLEGITHGLARDKMPFWIASEGAEVRCDTNDLAGLSFNIKNLVKKNASLPTRVVVDFLSALLLFNQPETVYRFLSQLFADIKQYNTVLLAFIEEGMHKPEVIATMEELFDGVITVGMSQDERGLTPVLSVKKMRGISFQKGASVNLLEPGEVDRGDTRRDDQSKRIAVLPFASFSPDPDDEYFADGMTEELISAISNIGGLGVISRTSVMGYKETNKKAKEIGRELGVGSLLEGSVRKSGNKLRITVQLIRVGEDEHIWAESYDRNFDDIFAVQSDIAKRVADALRIRILPKETSRLEKMPTRSTEAYTFYLKGRYFWNERSKKSLLKAIEYFGKAIEIDPEYALAYSGRADCYTILSNNLYMRYEEAFPRAEEDALKAVQLDESSGEAHTSLANVLVLSYDLGGAEKEFKKALDLNPNYATVHHWYGTMLLRAGKFDESLREVSLAQRLDPLSPMITVNRGDVYAWMKKYDLAEEQYRKALDNHPNFGWSHVVLSWLYMRQEKYDEAEKELKEYMRLTNDEATGRSYLGILNAFAGKREEAMRILDEVSEARSWTPNYPFVYAYLRLGEKEKAIQLIQRAFEGHASWLTTLAFDSTYSSVKSDPRVVEILKKIGLGS